MISAQPLQPPTPTLTRWYNPTKYPMKLAIFVGPQVPGSRYVYPIPPGETADIPSEFDAAIHQTHNGQVVGGLAPLAQKVCVIDRGRELPVEQMPITDALDPAKAQERDLLEKAQSMVAARKIADAEAARIVEASAAMAKANQPTKSAK